MVDVYYVGLVVFGLVVIGAVLLPRLLSERPLSLPIIYVGAGYVLFSLPLGIGPPDMVGDSVLVERLTELVVIVALMGAGLKIDRPFSLRAWSPTWRLLAITMPVTIAAAVVLGWWVLGLHIATAILLGAVLAPTDPVLASSVDAGPPASQIDGEADQQVEGGTSPSGPKEGRVRFALTSEAGLNDGLAFPFTNLAIAVAAASAPASFVWLGEWLLVDVAYKIAVGVLAGALLGYAGALIVFRLPASSRVARALAGAEALSGTLIIYGLTEMANGYGFIAVFVGALVLRHFEWEHEYYLTLHDFAVLVEQLALALVLVLFGGAIAGGLLAPLTLEAVGIGLALLVLVRPLAGVVGLAGSSLSWPARGVVAAFGIRGIGSFYYLSHALNEASFRELELVVAANQIWALVGFVVLGSVVLHGVSAGPVMDAFDRWEDRSE